LATGPFAFTLPVTRDGRPFDKLRANGVVVVGSG
jgi:hypothetical protein